MFLISFIQNGCQISQFHFSVNHGDCSPPHRAVHCSPGWKTKNTLEILDIDVLNNTPLIHIKPYAPAFDAKTENVRSGWLEENQVKAQTMTSDRRFI